MVPPRLLGIDYGRKRVGMAASDPLGITALPLRTHHGEPDEAIADIAGVCEEMGIGRIVVGLPFNMDGSEGAMAAEVRRFGASLSARTGLTVEFWDERLTSWEAGQDLRRLKGRHSKDRGRLDAMAAAVILRAYMARHDP